MIEIDRNLLFKASEALAPALEPRNEVPVLEHYLLQRSGDLLLLSATDLDVWATAAVGQIAPGPDFLVTVHAKAFGAALRASMPGCVVRLRADGDRIELESPGFNASICSFPGTDFPTGYEPSDDAVRFKVGGADLSMALARVSPAISKEETRYYLNGVCLAENGGKVEAVATDGHRLALVQLPISVSPWPAGYILPRRVVKVLRHVEYTCCDKERDSVQFRLEAAKNRGAASVGDIWLKFKLIDGTFPEFRRVIPNRTEDQIVLRTTAEAMRDALMSVSFGPDRHDCGPMTVEFGSEACAVSFGSESSPAKLTAEFAGSANVEHRFGVRRSYLAEALATISGPIVLHHRPGNDQPILLRAEHHPSWLHLLMPMRIL